MSKNETAAKKFTINRRDALKVTGAGLGAVALGSLVKNPWTAIAEFASPTTAAAATFIKGCDISYSEQMTSEGYTWKNSSGTTEDLLTILKGYGVNAIRLRAWVNNASGLCSTAATIAEAVKVKAAGMEVMIDFHYGDTFNSVGKQDPPAAWANYSYSQMETAVANYTYDFCEQMKAKGVTPTWCQIGNEINSGLLHPVGEISSHPDQMTGLLNKGYEAVKDVFPSCQCIIHLAQPQNESSIETFVSDFEKYGGRWDILGFSSYASGSEVPSLISIMGNFKSKYGKPVMQVETGFASSNPGAGKTDLSEYVKGVRDFGGLGVFYWEPEVYAPFNQDANSAWGTNKEPLETMEGFEV